MQTVSKCGLVALISTVALMSWADAAAAGDGWRIVDTVGTVRSGAPGVQPAALSNDQVLAADAWVETGADGRVVLKRGQETVVVSPKSRVLLPNAEVNGNTQVLQTLGSALYQIGKQQKPHFQVDTPYLAAVVKGTAFTVTVDGEKSTVAVTEGLVEVATPDRSDTEYVRPGFTALVSHGHTKDVVVQESPRAASDEKGAPEIKAEPKKDEHASKDPVVKIPGTIGDLAVDIPRVSNGLAVGDVPVVAAAESKANTTVSTVRTVATDVVATTGDVVQDVGGTVSDVGGGAVTTATTVVDATVTTVVPTVVQVVTPVVEVVPAVVPVVTEVFNPGGQSLPAQASTTAQTVVSTVAGATSSIVGGVAGGLGGLLGRGR